MKISVMTPTYNRGNLLKKLYNSLVQNSGYGVKIEWLIMDDGSTDETEKIIKEFENEKNSNIEIKYYKQENQGKMVAINNLMGHVTGEYVIDCDSDDYFTEKAFEIMKEKILKNEKEENIYGICFLKIDKRGENLGKVFTKKRSTLFDLHFKENDEGERAILFKTEIRKKYKHKLENNERFITEARMYYEMDKDNELICCNSPIMICEYQQAGYTNNIKEQFIANPCGYYKYFQEILERDMKDVLFKKRIYAIKHYILFSYLTKQYKTKSINNIENKILYYILLLPGILKSKSFKNN